MARILCFRVPANYTPPLKPPSQQPRGKLIEFCVRKSA